MITTRVKFYSSSSSFKPTNASSNEKKIINFFEKKQKIKQGTQPPLKCKFIRLFNSALISTNAHTHTQELYFALRFVAVYT
jgi:hypothetical protein